MKAETIKAILALVVLVTMAVMTIAVPYGPDSVTRGQNDRRTTFGSGAQQVQAQAGNVTQLTINTTMLTNRWQGYYGNITGIITLDDANGYTLYDWYGGGAISLVGEVYAANETISSWAQIKCVNISSTGKGYNCSGQDEWCLNLTTIEIAFGMASSDADGVDETFTTTQPITIGTTTLSNCPATNMYVNNASQTTRWNETLLTINNSNSSLIFAAEVEQNANGFNNKTWDFQMIVLDNGNVEGPTTYYFYVELA